LVEFYGMTEGGGSTMLAAHLFPDKLHTVGRPLPGHEIRQRPHLQSATQRKRKRL